jgi:uncharacterized protein (DUF1501 family)
MSELHLSRRTLLTGVAAAAATGGLGALAQAFASGRGASSSHVLVLLELRGGNDGLNTLAPVADPAYRRARRHWHLSGGVDAWALPSAWAGRVRSAAISRRRINGLWVMHPEKVPAG